MLMTDLDKQRFEHNDRVHAINQRVTELEEQLEASKNELDDMLKKLSEKQEECSRASMRSAQLISDNEQHQGALGSMQNELERLQIENTTLKSEKEKNDSQTEVVNAKIEEIKAEMLTQAKSVTQLMEENQKLKEDLVDAQKTHLNDVEERRIVTGNVDRLN